MKIVSLLAASVLALLAPRGLLAAVYDVTIENFAYTPEVLSIQVGDTVRWTNRDFIIHTATSQTGNGTLVPSGVFDSGDLDFDGVYQFTFTQAGTFYYYCLPHGSSMQATVTVTAPPPVCSADLNNDGLVNTQDLTAFLGAFGQSGPNLAADYNDDGAVNTADLVVLLAQFGCPSTP